MEEYFISRKEYTLIRSDRKTIAIRIRTDGTVEVRAPGRLPVREIERFLTEKRDWIEKHRNAMLERLPDTTDPRRILYLGQWRQILPGERESLVWDGENFSAPARWDDETIRAALPELYKKLAKSVIVPRTMEIAAETGKQPNRITVTSAKTKWGSCSGGVNLSFSWRLIAASPDVIDYVIVHELAHMTEMNHSSRFWALVEQRIPDWREKREKLTHVQSWLDAYFR